MATVQYDSKVKEAELILCFHSQQHSLIRYYFSKFY